MKDNRSGKELLIDIERKFDNLHRLIQNSDNNIKIMLGRLNDFISKPPTISVPVTVQPAKKPSKFEEAKRRHGIVDTDVEPPQRQKIVAKPVEENFENRHELVEEVVRKGQQRTQRIPKPKGGKVSVSQQIISPSGSPTFLASVEIMDNSGRMVQQTRTKETGRWTAALDPGEYTVHVIKRVTPNSGKEPIDIQYAIEVPKSTEPLELPSPEIE